jgi:hypothetical protein
MSSTKTPNVISPNKFPEQKISSILAPDQKFEDDLK